MMKVMQSNVVRMDPRVWGNDGYLPGVAIDQRKWAVHFQKVDANILGTYENTTKQQFAGGVRILADHCQAGDLAVIQHSGHGSQMNDTGGDEADGKDEILCLFDGQFRDDDVWDLMLLFRPGVRVLLITDTCYSGTMFRSMVADNLSGWARDSLEELNCSLLAIGTCSDTQTAADTNDGGAGSSSLLRTWELSTDYRDWILKAQKWLRANRFRQDMVLNEVNASAFVQQKPFQVGVTQIPSPAPVVPNSKAIAGLSVHFSDGSVQVIGRAS